MILRLLVQIEVKYIGMLKDGKVFDSSEGHPATFKFTLGKRLTKAFISVPCLILQMITTYMHILMVSGAHKVIAGWEQGIQGYKHSLLKHTSHLYFCGNLVETSFSLSSRHACRWEKETDHSSCSGMSVSFHSHASFLSLEYARSRFMHICGREN